MNHFDMTKIFQEVGKMNDKVAINYLKIKLGEVFELYEKNKKNQLQCTCNICGTIGDFVEGTDLVCLSCYDKAYR